MQSQRDKGRLEYALKKKNPEFIKNNNKKAMSYYNKNKKNPSFMKKIRERSNLCNKILKRIMIFYYSNGYMKCVCCGEKTYKFLQIDHINNDGSKHRKEINSKNIYRWLFKNDFPKGFQVLCSNCNHGKSINGGICPHIGIKDE